MKLLKTKFLIGLEKISFFLKKLILLFSIIFFAGFVSAGTICCTNGCFDDTTTYEGVDYKLQCCSVAAPEHPEQKNTAYVGCLATHSTEGPKSFCYDSVFGGCLKCSYNAVTSKYEWENIEATACGACKHCDYDDISSPTTATCVFDDNYICIGGTDTCLIEGQTIGDYCCKSNGVADVGPGCDAYPDENTCYYSGTTSCSAATGWSECSYQSETISSVDCYTTGDLVDNKCYITDRTKNCKETGWECTSGSYCVIGECSGQPDADGDEIPDVCDTESNALDCSDNKDNDGDETCDTNGCRIGGRQLPKDESCQNLCGTEDDEDLCSDCGGLLLDTNFCDKAECEESCDTSRGGRGSCHFYGINSCCDDYDNDGRCDSEDNCDEAPNYKDKGTCIKDTDKSIGGTCYNNDCNAGETCSLNQEDSDEDKKGDACDACPNVDGIGLSADEKMLCTETGEITCSPFTKCTASNGFFCNGDTWIGADEYQCSECFFIGEDPKIGYYWIENKNAVCNLNEGKIEYTDAEEEVCRFLGAGACGDGESGCWDEKAAAYNADTSPYTQCCGDDEAESWINSEKKGCCEGTFTVDADGCQILCTALTGYTSSCENNKPCWADDKCCGDDTGESWTYSTSNKIEDILKEESCYKGKWFNRENKKVTYYEIFN